VPLLATAFFVFVCVYRIWKFRSNLYDYGWFANLISSLARGDGFEASLYMQRFGTNAIGDHALFGFAFLAPLAKIFGGEYFLAAIGGICAGLAVFMIPPLVKAITGKENARMALMLQLGLILNPMFFMPALTFHIESAFSFLILVAIWALHRGKDWILWVCVLLLLTASERASVSVFGLGIYAFLMLGRQRLGVGLAALSTVYFFAACYVIIPALSGIEYTYARYAGPFVDIPKKILYVIFAYGLWLFLPLSGARARLASLGAWPMIGLNLMANKDEQYWKLGIYNDTMVLFLMVAAIYGLANKWDKIAHKGRICAVLGVVCAVFLTSRAARDLRPMRYAPSPRALRALLVPYKIVGDDITVIANDRLTPYFSGNRRLNYVDNWNIEAARVRTVFTFGKHFETNFLGDNSPYDEVQRPQTWAEVLPRLLANPHLHLVAENEYGAVWSTKDLY
jgi:uncharacterized membrane protein